MNAAQAAAIGLVDDVGPRHPDAYAEWLTDLAERESDPRRARSRRAEKAKRLGAERVPLEVYEAQELAEMSRDMYGDRSGFAAARNAFVSKAKPDGTPPRLRLDGQSRTRIVGSQAERRATTLRPAIPVSA